MWLPDDTDEALAWQAEHDAACAGCGQPRDESFDPDLQHRWAAKALRCHACAAKRTVEREFAEADHTDGLYIVVER